MTDTLEKGNLLLFNLAMDADHSALNFTPHWVNRLASHYDCVDVITMTAGRCETAPNVRVFSVGKERGWSEPRRALEFYRLLAARLRERRYRACFAHMMPLFALMGAPLLKLARIPITLWYAHPHVSMFTRIAARISDHLVTSVPGSFAIPGDRVRAIGQGIDVDFFTARPDAMAEKTSGDVVMVARLTAMKNQITLIDVLPPVPQMRAVFVGAALPGTDGEAHRGIMERRGASLGVTQQMHFAGALDRDGVRAAYHRAFAAVNLAPPGSFDKSALEAMACAVPTIVCSREFLPLIEPYEDLLRVESPDDLVELRDHMERLGAMTAAERSQIGAHLRARVVALHSLDPLVARLVAVLNDATMESAR